MKIKRTIMAPVLVALVGDGDGRLVPAARRGEERNIYANARLFEDVLRFVSENFVDEKPAGRAVPDGDRRDAQELGDPHTSLMPARTTSGCGCRRRASTAASECRSIVAAAGSR
jgi:hypothetical protein